MFNIMVGILLSMVNQNSFSGKVPCSQYYEITNVNFDSVFNKTYSIGVRYDTDCQDKSGVAHVQHLQLRHLDGHATKSDLVNAVIADPTITIIK